jgi:uncharacterized membrane protein
MSLYELLLFVHVLAAAAWFGAALFSLLLVELSARGRDFPMIRSLGEYEDRLATMLFIPAALVTLASGIALVFDGPWSFGADGWVIAGLVLFVAIFGLGIGMIVPTGKKLKELAGSGAPQSELETQVGRLRQLSAIDVGLLALAIFFMTVKPF